MNNQSLEKQVPYSSMNLEGSLDSIIEQVSYSSMNLEGSLDSIVEQIKADVSEKKIKEKEQNLFDVARKLCQEEKYEESIKIYDELIEINPKESVYLNNKGFDLQRLGKLERAITCYDKAIEINPKKSAYLSNKGGSLELLGKLKEAVTCYDKAIEINPNEARAWNDKGFILSKTGDKKSALYHYKKALKINPKSEIYKENRDVVKRYIKSNSKFKKAKGKLTDIVSNTLVYGGLTAIGTGIAGGLAYGAYKAHGLFLNLANYFYAGSFNELQQEAINTGSSETVAHFVASVKYMFMNGGGGALTGAAIGIPAGLLISGALGIAGCYKDTGDNAITTTLGIGAGIGIIAGACGFLGAEIGGPLGTVIGTYCSPLVTFGIGYGMGLALDK